MGAAAATSRVRFTSSFCTRHPVHLTGTQTIVRNGYEYKSLGDHDPHSTKMINEYNKLYTLEPAWHISPKTADALHVCSSYPWAAKALVFADGSAHYTASLKDSSFDEPGSKCQPQQRLLRNELTNC